MMAGGVRRNGHTDYWGDYHAAAEAMEAGALVLSQDFDLMNARCCRSGCRTISV